MRRTEFELPPAAARALLAELPTFHLASTTPDGAPLLRTLHGVIVDGWLAFHSAPRGEKTAVVGRPAVAMAEELVATVPSTFFDPEKACPATTYYRSAQVHGTVEELVDPAARARALQALMEKLQPEGGHVPITAAHPHYRAAVRGLLVAGLRLERVAGKAKLAQNRKPAEVARLLESLWRRGAPGDPRALELIRAANPAAPTPAFLAAPAGADRDGVTLHAWLPPALAEDAAELLVDAYWNQGAFTRAELVRAHRSGGPWVGARDRAGRLVASARAVSDGGKRAWLYDVIIAPAWRGRGLGQAVTRLVLDHPEVRAVREVALATRDAQTLYARFGFVERSTLPPRAFPSTELVRLRDR
ncbi:MAG: GNAT family N-acetyltransferase [Kofleriaceae bacterium]|nr:GNAT family N-acetyltransferase [Kofleriaceae bacterium]MCL4227632.1 GNAT family N-acetyltransferase [Myxococcales bacterium]